MIAYERKTEGKTIFETIDGQQRLTTLSILLSLIKNDEGYTPEDGMLWYNELNLKFDSRKNTTNTLQLLFKGITIYNDNCNTAIKQGHEDAKKALKGILKDCNVTPDKFCDYLFNKVNILRVLVPDDTDLNHYFEIMNSRGEQLEKHEILKANCLEALDESDRYGFNLIWEACSNMEKYVQYEFDTTQRNTLFGSNLNTLIDKNQIYNCLKPQDNKEPNNNQGAKISDLLKHDAIQYSDKQQTNDENPERFNTVINFSNFLLHILRIQTKQNVALDDKRLIELFEPFLKDESNKKEFVKTFGYNLLKGKFMFDKYIIKREFTRSTDHWSLKQIKVYEQTKISYVNTFGNEESNDDININREILMLLSMFHVSTPALVYKHWLNAALKYVFENENIEAEKYKIYLENLAKAYLNDRYLAVEPKDYFEIIYNNGGISQNKEIDESKLNQGTAVEIFIFNYLDYLLWQDYKHDQKYFETDIIKKDNRIKYFEFTFRSSVEHYYPQHPIDEKLKNDDIQCLDDFGNLCLISGSKNSRLSNYMPQAKKEHYHNSPTIDSIKQRVMMEYKQWDTNGTNNRNEIEEHGRKMKEILCHHLR